MQYRKDKYGNDLSVLGFGCMRFQRKAGMIDMEEAEREIMLAYQNGVNYFDTAYEQIKDNYNGINLSRDNLNSYKLFLHFHLQRIFV